VSFLRPNLAAVSVVVAAAAVAIAIVTFARTTYHRQAEPAPPDHGLPFARAKYDAIDVRRAFAPEGVALILRSKLPSMTELGDRGSVVEVTVFGDAAKVAAAGVYDDTTDAQGHYVRFPTTCANGARVVERWRGNVRAIVLCRAGTATLRRVERALADLPAR